MSGTKSFGLACLSVLLSSCAGKALTAPAEAYLALGAVAEHAVPAEEKTVAPVDVEADLEAWRKKFRDNARLMRSLSWNCRVRYRMPGSFTIHLLYRANTDANGDVQVNEVSRRLEVTQGLTRSAAAVEAADADYTMAATLAALSRAYTFPLPGAMDNLLQSGKLGATPAIGGLLLHQPDFVMPGDSAELTLSPSLIEPKTLSFHGLVEGMDVNGMAKFRKLPDGTFYPATVDLTLPQTNATVLVENFGFRMQPAFAAPVEPAP